MRSSPGRLRVGLIGTPITGTPVAVECRKAAEDAGQLCETLGHNVEEISLPVDPREFFGANGIVMASTLVARVRSREKVLGREATANDLEPIIWQRYRNALGNTAEQLFEAAGTLESIARRIALLQRDYDVLLSPTLTKPPVAVGKMRLNQDNEPYEQEAVSVSAFTLLYNATGQPAMSVPLHWTPSGLPVGVMFAGRYGEEHTLFQLAGQLEQARPWFDKLPPL